jgi:hypothetical protein
VSQPDKKAKKGKQPNNGSIKPGEVRNPKGRPPKGYSLAEFMRARLEEDDGWRLKLLFEKVFEKATEEGNVSAAAELLTRAYGKPVDTVKFEDVTKRERPEGILDLARTIGANTSISGPTQPLD